jgi:hypothetical protein
MAQLVETQHDNDHEAAKSKTVEVTVSILPQGEAKEVELSRSALVFEVLKRGVELAGEKLLPNEQEPFDTLHNILHKNDVSEPIADLQQPLTEYLKKPKTTKHFGIKLAQAIRVNTLWKIASEAQMTPQQILDLFNLDTSYTLYRKNSSDPLSLNEAIEIKRGLELEAQKDGHYGSNL